MDRSMHSIIMEGVKNLQYLGLCMFKCTMHIYASESLVSKVGMEQVFHLILCLPTPFFPVCIFLAIDQY